MDRASVSSTSHEVWFSRIVLKLQRPSCPGGRGLIGRRSLPEGFALVIQRRGAIHTFFMTVAIDVAHIDREGRVVKFLHHIRPWRIGPIVPKSAWLVEIPAGVAMTSGLRVGDIVRVVEENMM